MISSANSQNFDGYLDCVESTQDDKRVDASETPHCICAIVQPFTCGVAYRVVSVSVVLYKEAEGNNTSTDNEN